MYVCVRVYIMLIYLYVMIGTNVIEKGLLSQQLT